MWRFIFKGFSVPFSLLITCVILFPVCLPSYAGDKLSGDSKGLPSAFADRLDPEEKVWLEDHPEITMGIMNAWPPMNFVDDQGKPHGIGVDYIGAVNQRLGGVVKLAPGPFKDNLAAVKAKTLDALMDVTPKPEREKFLNFTRQYLDIPHVIVAPADGPYFASERDLVGHTLALETGFYNVVYFRNKYPSLTIKEYPDTKLALCAVSRGEADAYVGNRAAAAWIMEQELISNLRIQGHADKPGSVLTIGVRKDWPLFVSILDKALADLTVEEVREIHLRWTGMAPGATKVEKISLTPEEKAWISGHSVIKIGIGHSWAPFVYIKKNGGLEGYDVDFLAMINKLTGADIQLVAGPWKDIVGQAEHGVIDGLAESAVVESRREHFLFTDPYNVVEYAAATLPEKAANIRTAFDLKGKRIALLKGNKWAGKIIASIGEVRIIEAKSEEEAFRFVVEGKADFALIPVHQYMPLRKIYHQSLAIAHVFTNEEFVLRAVYSIRKDWPELVSIINKALWAIDENEKQALFEKWVPSAGVSAELALPSPVQFDKTKFLLQSLGAIFFCMAVIIAIVWLLKGRPRQVSIRHSLILISFIFASLIAASSAFVILLAQTHQYGDEIIARHFESLNLAFELKQSSDDMTRFARTFAVTGNPKYENYFRKIIAIRDGRQAHPKNFNLLYWDYVAAGNMEPDQEGEIYSIEQRIIKLGLSKEEISKLLEAKKESDDLINLENIAMNAVKGLYKDNDGQFTIKGDPDMAMARNLLHGKEYHDAKARIMKPIDQFFTLLKWRMSNDRNQLHRRMETIILDITILVIITIGFSIYVFFLMRRRIIVPLSTLEEGAKTIEKGDYSHQIGLASNDEIGALAAVFNSMARSIEENTSRLHATIESTTDGILVVDLNQKVTTYNTRFLEIWHLDQELIEIGNDEILLNAVLVHLKDPEAFLDHIKQLYANPKEEDFDTLFLRDGRIIERYSRPQRLGHRIIGRVWSFRDATERNRAEAELRKFSLAIEASPASVVITDTKGTIQYVNPKFSELTGYSAQEVIGRNSSILKSGVQTTDFYKEMLSRIKTGNVWRGEICNRKKNGELYWESAAIAPVKNAQGEISHYVAVREDITLRRQAEEDLKRAKENAELLYKMIPSAVFTVDLEQRVTSWNDQAARITGYSAEEMMGRKCTDFALDPCTKTCGLFSLDMPKPMFNRECKIKTKDGRIRIIKKNVDVLSDNNGSIIGGIECFDDITERLQIEKELQKLSQAVEQSPAIVVITDTQGTIEYVNPRFSMLTGYTVEEAVGENTRILKSGTHTSDFYKEMWSTILAGNVWHGEFCNRKKNGELYWESTAIAPVKNERGDITHYVAVKEDITERREMETALKKSQEQLLEAAKISNLGYFELDFKTMIFTPDTLFWGLLGTSIEEEGGETIRFDRYLERFCHPEDRAGVERKIQSILSAKKAFEGELEHRMIRKDGIIRNAYVRFHIDVDEAGTPQKGYGFHHDITERKQAEMELLRAKEAAEIATRAKSDFLANMSHEIRTPMNAIIGISHLALKTDLTPKQYDYISKIDTSAKALLGIINDILDFSKIEAGELNMELIDFQLNHVMSNLSNLISGNAQEKGLELIFYIHPDTPAHLQGDPLRLGQILLNLTNNAVKFTEKGEILVSVHPLETEKDHTLLKFSVRDSGIGLTEEQQERLFKSFQQADASTTRKFGGSGLGLAISKKLAEMMGGEIGVKSVPGMGSTFFFTARFGLHDRADLKIRPTLESLTGIKVMVVDDNETFMEVMRTYLEDFEFEVETVETGSKAVDRMDENVKADQKPFDLILMDWQMPGMDGIDACRQIRKRPDLKTMPKIILTTGFEQEQLIRQAEDIRLDGILLKPITQSMLFDAVMEAFGQKASRTPKRITNDFYRPDGYKKIRGAHILLVEDNEINQQVASELLKAEGFFITLAENGRVALDKVFESSSENPFDLVLMDLQMPVMDGYTATKEIRKQLNENDLPVIAMTADAMSGVQERTTSVGMNDFISKPIDPALLFRTLLKWIQPGERKSPKDFGALKPEGGVMEETLPDLPDIDVENGVKRVGGDIRRYKNLLIKFIQNQGNADQKIRAAMAGGNKEKAVRLAHTLKGVSGTIGANALHEKAKELEGFLRLSKAEEAGRALEESGRLLARTVEILLPIKEEEKRNVPPEELDSNKLKKQMKILKAYLDEDDSKAEDAVNRILSLVDGTPLEDSFKKIQEDISEIEYENALEKLAKVMERVTNG